MQSALLVCTSQGPPVIGVPTARILVSSDTPKRPNRTLTVPSCSQLALIRGSPTQLSIFFPRLVLDATSAGFGPRVSFRDFCDICFLQLGGSVGLNMSRF